MQLIILGAGAGGGLPQWNCGCQNCALARNGQIPKMTQSSVAVSADGVHWSVLNASPDIREQVALTPAMHPKSLRDTPISSVVLTNGDIDHIAGLLTLREKTPFTVFATGEGMGILETNSVFNVLDRSLVVRETITLDTPFGAAPGLTITPLAVPCKVALILEGETVGLEEVGENTVGLMLEDGTHRVAYIPGCAAIPDWVVERVADVDLLLFDGTVWNNDDMQATGTGQKTGARMGHIPMNGDQGSLARLSGLSARKVYLHINNTNPILAPESPERAAVLAAGWEIAGDGLKIGL